MRRTVLALPLLAAAPALAAVDAPHRVLELRQYRTVPGKRDAMIALFDRWFVESQEALGARIVGQFRVAGDPDRFVWIREFPDMARRAEMLDAFYSGPVWQAHRDDANPMLDDNDNVLLLRAAGPALGFAPATGDRPTPDHASESGGRGATIAATIHYLWKPADERFTQVFINRAAPLLAGAGVTLIGGFVPEEAPNNFPRLPVRQGERLFVWLARIDDARSLSTAMRKLRPMLTGLEERPAQMLGLIPTARSLLR